MQRAGRMGHFQCAPGFELHGAMNILCQMGRWKQEIPICISNDLAQFVHLFHWICGVKWHWPSDLLPILVGGGCKMTDQRANGWVMTDEKKQQAMLYCHVGFSSAGSSYAYCNGAQWDRELGECRPSVIENTKTCDFETISQCGWTEAIDNDFHWLRRNGWNSYEKLESGPKHDHTVRKHNFSSRLNNNFFIFFHFLLKLIF